MENIYISGFEGKTITFHIPSSKMRNYTVMDLKKQIRDRTGTEVESQRLLYGVKEVEDTRNVMMTLQDYGITSGANILLVTLLPGYCRLCKSVNEELNKKKRELERIRRDLEEREQTILEREYRLGEGVKLESEALDKKRRELEMFERNLEERVSSIRKKEGAILLKSTTFNINR